MDHSLARTLNGEAAIGVDGESCPLRTSPLPVGRVMTSRSSERLPQKEASNCTSNREVLHHLQAGRPPPHLHHLAAGGRHTDGSASVWSFPTRSNAAATLPPLSSQA